MKFSDERKIRGSHSFILTGNQSNDPLAQQLRNHPQDQKHGLRFNKSPNYFRRAFDIYSKAFLKGLPNQGQCKLNRKSYEGAH